MAAEENATNAGRSAIRGRVGGHSVGGNVTDTVLTLIDEAGRQLGRTRVDGDGRFDLAVPAPGTYVLIASSESQRPEALSVTVGESPAEVDIEFAAAATVVGSVRLRAGGAPASSAAVTVTDRRGDVVASALTGPDGAYALSDVPTGDHTMVVACGSLRPWAQQITVPESGTLSCDVTLDGGAALSVSVTSAATGIPVADARVTLMDESGDVAGAARTDRGGTLQFPDLADGSYTVIANGVPPASAALRVIGGSYSRHDVRLGDDAKGAVS